MRRHRETYIQGRWPCEPKGRNWDVAASQTHTGLPEWAKKCWRWRLLLLRAIIDFELSHNDNEPNDVTEKAMLELVEIYEVSPVTANRRVTPFTDEWIRHHIDKNFKLNLSLLGVD